MKFDLFKLNKGSNGIAMNSLFNQATDPAKLNETMLFILLALFIQSAPKNNPIL